MADTTMSKSDKVRQLTWKFLKETFELACETADKIVAVFKLRDFYPNVDLEKIDDLELGLMVNGLKQRLADKAAVSKDLQMTGAERIASMKELGDKLLTARTYALGGGGGGGGLTSDQQWTRHFKAMTAEGVAAKVARKICNTLYPKAVKKEEK